MTEIIVQQWGDDFALLVPQDVAKNAGLSVGERVDVSILRGNLVLRRLPRHGSLEARKAAEDMMMESKNYTLGTSIRSLLDEGRRG